jgi:hypothetical protein
MGCPGKRKFANSKSENLKTQKQGQKDPTLLEFEILEFGIWILDFGIWNFTITG